MENTLAVLLTRMRGIPRGEYSRASKGIRNVSKDDNDFRFIALNNDYFFRVALRSKKNVLGIIAVALSHASATLTIRMVASPIPLLIVWNQTETEVEY